MSEHPSPPYNLPDTGEEAAEAVIEVAEAALGFGGGVAAAAAVEAVEVAVGGATDMAGSPRRALLLCQVHAGGPPSLWWPLSEQAWQRGDVCSYATRLVLGKHFGDVRSVRGFA